MPHPLIYVGAKFGQYTVISDKPERRGKGTAPQYHYLCRCTCGTERFVYGYSLTAGKSKSCGCTRDSETAYRSTTHGMSRTPIYAIWNMMKQRCLVPTYRLYKDYGGRGITVCERWKSFELFYADVGDPPFKGASLDRIDNNGNYEPGNVRWATRTEQNRNKRNTRKFEFDGRSLTLQEWSEVTGIKHQTLASRLYVYGWSVEKALTTPVAA